MLIGYEDVELARLKKRQQELEHNVFARPPADWTTFSVMRGRWMELNERINEINKALNEEDVKERNS